MLELFKSKNTREFFFILYKLEKAALPPGRYLMKLFKEKSIKNLFCSSFHLKLVVGVGSRGRVLVQVSRSGPGSGVEVGSRGVGFWVGCRGRGRGRVSSQV